MLVRWSIEPAFGHDQPRWELDELTAGQSPNLQDEIFVLTHDQPDRRLRVVMVEQNARRAALQNASRLYLNTRAPLAPALIMGPLPR